jgi:hypothetical protein
MAVDCSPGALVAAAKCFECIPPSMQKPVELYLLAVANGLATDKNGVQTIVQNAKCFTCIPKALRDPAEEYLLCALVNK